MKPKIETWNLVLSAVLVAVTVAAFFFNISAWFTVGKQNHESIDNSTKLQTTIVSPHTWESHKFNIYRTA